MVKINKKIIILLFFLLLSSIFEATFQNKSWYKEGNKYYRAKDYLQAIDCYLKIVNSKLHNANVYYNLGNAYFKARNLGKALLFYKRALILKPRDKEIKSNFEYLSSLLNLKKEEKSLGEITFIFKISNFFNLKELTIFVSVFYFIICFLIILYIFLVRGNIKKICLLLSSLLLIFLILGAIVLSNKIYQTKLSWAMITKEKVLVRSGPGNDFTSKFYLPQGTEVLIKEKREGWYKIYFSKDFTGWLSETDIEKVF